MIDDIMARQRERERESWKGGAVATQTCQQDPEIPIFLRELKKIKREFSENRQRLLGLKLSIINNLSKTRDAIVADLPCEEVWKISAKEMTAHQAVQILTEANVRIWAVYYLRYVKKSLNNEQREALQKLAKQR